MSIKEELLGTCGKAVRPASNGDEPLAASGKFPRPWQAGINIAMSINEELLGARGKGIRPASNGDELLAASGKFPKPWQAGIDIAPIGEVVSISEELLGARGKAIRPASNGDELLAASGKFPIPWQAGIDIAVIGKVLSSGNVNGGKVGVDHCGVGVGTLRLSSSDGNLMEKPSLILSSSEGGGPKSECPELSDCRWASIVSKSFTSCALWLSSSAPSAQHSALSSESYMQLPSTRG